LTKFGVVFLIVLAAAGAWSLIVPRSSDRDDRRLPVWRNERLTALAGAALYILVVAIVVTVLDISGLLAEHYLVGFLLIPPIALKLGSTGYRLFRYYEGSPAYRQAGAPPIVLRFLVAPVLVASTVVVFATGLELWLFGVRLGSGWMQAHTLSAVVMLLAAAAHVIAHLRRSGEVVRDDVVAPGREALTGGTLVAASLLLGAILAVASLLYATPFPPAAAGG
jgi:hypothetical protein